MEKVDHLLYIKKKGKIKGFRTYGLYFPDAGFIIKWYKWFEGLINKEIDPITPKQKRFLKYFKEVIKPMRYDLPSIHSKGYTELTKNQKSLIRYFFVKLHKEKIINLHNTKQDNSIYYYSKVFLEFGKGNVKNLFRATQYDIQVRRERNKD